jgi:hypothetical protein
MWETRIDVLNDGRVRRVAKLRDGAPVSYAQTIEQWRTSQPFRAFGRHFFSGLDGLKKFGMRSFVPWSPRAHAGPGSRCQRWGSMP